MKFPTSSSKVYSPDNNKESSLCKKWREIHGADNWNGLIPSPAFQGSNNDSHFEIGKPCCSTMDEDLRSEIIKYGEFSQACYDAFNNDKNSISRGDCKFTPAQLLRETTTGEYVISSRYEVTKYLYTTAHSDVHSFLTCRRNSSNWMGFVAVSTSEEEISRLGSREIIVSWRGTVTGLEWIENLHDVLQHTGLEHLNENRKGIKVEKGFLNLYKSRNPRSRHNKESAREQLLGEVRRLVDKYRGEELSITITGHSLGGALSLLSAYDIAELLTSTGLSKVPTTVFSFSAPRVGNRLFAARCEELNVRVLRIVNRRDIVPKVPGIVLNERHSNLSQTLEGLAPCLRSWEYAHVGNEFALDMRDSPYLRRQDADLIAQHNLEVLLHLVDGYQGPGKEFRPSGRRPVELVNKTSSASSILKLKFKKKIRSIFD